MLGLRWLAKVSILRAALLFGAIACVILGATLRPRTVIFFAVAAVLWVAWLVLRIWSEATVFRLAAERATSSVETDKAIRARRHSLVRSFLLIVVSMPVLATLAVVVGQGAAL